MWYLDFPAITRRLCRKHELTLTAALGYPSAEKVLLYYFSHTTALSTTVAGPGYGGLTYNSKGSITIPMQQYTITRRETNTIMILRKPS